MAKFKQFINTDTGEVVTYPEHFGDHPAFGLNLKPFDGETEVDKVVTEGHELPVEQRASYFAVEAEEPDFETDNDEEDKED